MQESWENNVLQFVYDESGAPYALRYSADGGSSWRTFYYILNLQGDVVELVYADKTVCATYTYNAWGQIISAETTAPNITANLAELNPLRYRGYYYDTETGFYYLQSRYYDPVVKRFLNADNITLIGSGNTVLSYNAFAYCTNSPVSKIDADGNFGITIGIMAVGGLIGAAISAVSSIATQQVLTGTVNWKSVAVSTATGFVSGAVAASPLGIAGQRIAGGVIGGMSYVADCYVNDRELKLDEAALSVGMGVLSGEIGGSGANKNRVLTNAYNSASQAVEREGRRANQQYALKMINSALSYRDNFFSTVGWGASVRFAAGSGISNGVMGKITSLDLFPDFPSWKPW